MQNSFEKQVQDKMDELRFAPTEPVWQNIEKQIRAKKERRRFLLWLPLLFLVLGGSAWWLNTQDQKSQKATVASRKSSFEAKQNVSTPPNNQDKAIGHTDASIPSAKPEINAKAAEGTASQNPISPVRSSARLERKKQKAAAVPTLSSSLAVIEKQTTLKELPAGNEGKNTKAAPSQYEISVTSVQAGGNEPLQPGAAEKDSAVQNSIAAIKPGVKTDSIQQGTVPAVRIKKTGTYKWQWGFVANAGVSGIARGFGSLSLNQSFDAAPNYSTSPGPTPQFSNGPSPLKDDWAFSVGLIANKRLSKRLSFSTGLQYHYYSTQRSVGLMRRQDSVLNANKSVSRFFLNTGTSFSDYRNLYHFISIPASIDWQLLKKIPLSLQAGLSLQQLIGTNALLYDTQNNIYYTDKEALKKTQLFSSFGLFYALNNKGKTSLLLGPQMQYGLSKLEKSTSGKHLFTLGLTAQFLFQEK